jgi:hypothetical protein
MARISPLSDSEASTAVKAAFSRHTEEYNARITNMKSTLGHSILAFEVYMQWYPLYEQVEGILGKRLARIYAYVISYASDCPLCSTFFRKLIIDAGEKPEQLVLSQSQQNIINFGNSIGKHHGHIADHVYNDVAKEYTTEQMVVLIAFAGQMIATNVFNNVIETDIDQYLFDYLPPVKFS